MKALQKIKPEKGLWLTDIPEFPLGHNDVCIKVKKTAICGTDVHIYQWDEWAAQTVPIPLVVGHEFVGEIVAIGEHVRGFKVHDRVSGEGHISCGFCRNCRAGRRHVCRKNESVGVTRTGAFAEFIVIPAVNAYPIPDNVSDSIASILDPLGNAAHCALSFNLVGEDVLITGAGPVGIMAAAISKHIGARHIVVTDTNDHRLEIAKKMGASLTINVKEQNLDDAMRILGMREGFDVGLEMSGNPHAFRDMLAHMNHAGKVALLGFLPKETEIDWNHIIMRGLLLKGIYGREMFETWYKMISMLQGGLNIAPVITHEFHYTEYQKAFETILTGKSGKVILSWE
ncbi:MAG TPA: L-threonine 3-dehydrogenase [Gammaproteobacteria bacterium]|jgi:threonine 3-dehydrogenase|nr:L-threonine 3-dehydrogenase [Gammaproteobacteria bacterium]